LQPFADQRTLKAAGELGLPEDPKALARAAGTNQLPRLGAPLVRMTLAADADAVLAEAET
jgi:hypothetical protein